jgi:hypothetical protein
LAIILVILPDHGQPLPPDLQIDKRPAAVVNKYASPLECIFCPSRIPRLAAATGCQLPKAYHPIPVKEHIPGWAAELQEEARQSTSADADPEESSPNYSLVLPFIEGASDDEDRPYTDLH